MILLPLLYYFLFCSVFHKLLHVQLLSLLHCFRAYSNRPDLINQMLEEIEREEDEDGDDGIDALDDIDFVEQDIEMDDHESD